MTNLTPSGIDAISGQRRLLTSSDTLTDTAGNPIANPIGTQVYSSSNTVVSGAAVPLSFDLIAYDPNGYWTAFQNSRITPTVAGKYKVLGQVAWNAVLSPGAVGWRNIWIRLTGSVAQASSLVMAVTAIGQNTTQEINAIVTMNGTTDYVELMVSRDPIASAASSIIGGSVFNGGLTLQRIA